MEKIRLGIIGIGNMGAIHCRHILDGKCPEIELVAVADVKESRRQWAKENLPESVAVFATAEEMLDSGLINGCIVAVPHYDHPKYAMECMKRDIHVMVEKPAGVYTKQVREMNEEAKKHNAAFGMMFNQRATDVYIKVHELVHSGKYGQIRRTNWIITNWYRPQAYYDSGDWRATWSGEGGGVLLNQCPHQLDLWQWICGMPVKVMAKIKYGQWHDIEVDDDVTAFVEYENGATGVFVTTTGDGNGSNRLEIQMDKCQIIVDGNDIKMVEYDISEPEHSKTNTDPFGPVPKHEVKVTHEGRAPHHPAVLNAWADHILHGGKMIAEGYEGINGLTLSNAMHLSSWLNKEITLPLDEDLYYEELMKRVATSRRKTNVKEVVANAADTFSGSK